VGYIFEWDPAKADANARKHGVTFDGASTVFGDPLNLLMLDSDHAPLPNPIGVRVMLLRLHAPPSGLLLSNSASLNSWHSPQSAI
jgi:hypothetical protein